MSEVLAFARALAYEPGSNIRGEQADTTWLFLLGDLDLGTVSVLGTPPAGTLVALEAQAARVVRDGRVAAETRVLYTAGGAADALREQADRVREVLARGGAAYAEPGAAAALVEVAGAGAQVRLAAVPAPSGAAAPGAAAPGEAIPTAWLVPAAPLPRTLPGAALARRGVTVVRRLLRRPVPASAGGGLIGVAGTGAPGTVPPDHGVLLRPASDPARLPEYVRAAAREAGTDLDGAGWRIAPPRGFRSQKVVFHVTGPDAIVKLTQDPRFNPRLDNEWAGLSALAAATARPGLAPRPLFRAEHAGLLLVAQSRLDGEPLRSRSDATPGCPVIAAVLDALVGLGTATASPRPSGEVAAALAELLEHHRRIHAPEAARLRALTAAFDALAEVGGDLPAVFLHGDVSTHNVLVGEDRAIGLVDWENADPTGLPGWDLTYFVNACAQWDAALRGPRITPASITARLTADGPWRDLLADALRRLSQQIGLPREALPGVLLGFWMQLALRESTRLPAGGAPAGTYARVLARMLDEDGPGRLARLL